MSAKRVTRNGSTARAGRARKAKAAENLEAIGVSDGLTDALNHNPDGFASLTDDDVRAMVDLFRAELEGAVESARDFLEHAGDRDADPACDECGSSMDTVTAYGPRRRYCQDCADRKDL